MRTTIRRPRACMLGLLLLGILQGCQTAGSLPVSHAMPELSSAASEAIALDMTAKLTEHVAGGSTIELRRDDSSFAAALEASLTNAGYAVSAADQKGEVSGQVQLAYVIEHFDGQVLARLATADVDLGRTYSVTEAGASPSSPLSVKERG